MNDVMLEVKDLSVQYASRKLFFKKTEPAIQNISFRLQRGTILGIVGESGSGKTTLLRTLLRLLPAKTGSISFDGDDWLALTGSTLINTRRKIGVVTQNPFLSLSPRLSIEQILSEPLSAGAIAKPWRQILQLAMASVGLPAEFLNRKAADLSGGQAQRVAIARALILKPKLLILDEATSALDVSVQAQVLNLLMEIQQAHQLSVIFVSHDLDVVQHLSDDMLVMRNGRIVEYGRTDLLVRDPQNEYTRQLLTARNSH